MGPETQCIHKYSVRSPCPPPRAKINGAVMDLNRRFVSKKKIRPPAYLMQAPC